MVVYFFVINNLMLSLNRYIMDNEYNCECEGCGDTVIVYVDGFIGSIDDVWCDDCGYGGENIEKREEEENKADIERQIFVQGAIEEDLMNKVEFDKFNLTSIQKQPAEMLIHFFNEEDEIQMKKLYAESFYNYMRGLGAY